MRIKARALGIAAEDYFNDKVLEDTELLYSGMGAAGRPVIDRAAHRAARHWRGRDAGNTMGACPPRRPAECANLQTGELRIRGPLSQTGGDCLPSRAGKPASALYREISSCGMSPESWLEERHWRKPHPRYFPRSCQQYGKWGCGSVRAPVARRGVQSRGKSRRRALCRCPDVALRRNARGHCCGLGTPDS
jgi:hypothetical protein